MANKRYNGRQISTHCGGCGIEFDGTNKADGRALCLECKKKADIVYANNRMEKLKVDGLISKRAKKDPYKQKNRTLFWKDINKQLKKMKKREEWLPFIKNRMQEILNDKQLMDYINDTQIADYDTD